MSSILVDPAGAYVLYEGVRYYRDGILYGELLPEAPPQEITIPTLWSLLVIDYRKKPEEVQAIQLVSDNAHEIANWCGGVVVEEIDPLDSEKRTVGINVPTIEGPKRASEGDYVVKNSRGGFFPCGPSEFASTYELA